MFSLFHPDAVLSRIVGYMMEVLRQNWQTFLQRGILTSILGLLSVFWPAAMIPTLLLMLGAYVYCEDGWAALQDMMPKRRKTKQVENAYKPVEEPFKNADHGPSAVSMMALLALFTLRNEQQGFQAQQKVSGTNQNFQHPGHHVQMLQPRRQTEANRCASLLKPLYAKRPRHIDLLLKKFRRPKTQQPVAATAHAP